VKLDTYYEGYKIGDVWACSTHGIDEKCIGNTDVKGQIWRLVRKWRNNIKIELEIVNCDDGVWIHLA
jgi:hypothetical protein